MTDDIEVTLTMTQQEANLVLLAAARFAIPMRGNSATMATVDAILKCANILTPETRARIVTELQGQVYTGGDPWTDMDSAVYAEAAELLQTA